MIARHEGRMQIGCDTCPASFLSTYADDEFREMIAEAKAAGWHIRKTHLPPERDTTSLFGRAPRIAGPKKRPEPYTHTCPSCAAGASAPKGSLL